jgi:DMSO reductase anchor subunit
MVDTTDIEKKSLEAHVELCAERYRALELQIDSIKTDITTVKTVVHEVHEMVHDMADRRNNQIIGWGIGVIGFLTAALGYVFTHYVLK